MFALIRPVMQYTESTFRGASDAVCLNIEQKHNMQNMGRNKRSGTHIL